MVAVQVDGLAQLTRDLKKLEAAAVKKLRAVSKDAAQIVSDEAKSKAPVLTGRFRDKIKPGATQAGGYVAIRGLVYAGPIHFGWPAHNIRPNPVLYEALDARRAEVIAKFERGVADVVAATIHDGVR
jgi:bacteriophage HK97-gp10 putative tail-component